MIWMRATESTFSKVLYILLIRLIHYFVVSHAQRNRACTKELCNGYLNVYPYCLRSSGLFCVACSCHELLPRLERLHCVDSGQFHVFVAVLRSQIVLHQQLSRQLYLPYELQLSLLSTSCLVYTPKTHTNNRKTVLPHNVRARLIRCAELSSISRRSVM